MKKKIFKAFNLGVSIMILTNLICSTGFAEESVIPVKAVKSYSNIHALPNSFGSRFEVVQETQTDYDISFVKKADFDQLTSDDKLKMKNSLRNDLNNKKSITFMGDADNLNIEALYEILGIKEQVIIEYEDEVAQNNLQYLTSISFFILPMISLISVMYMMKQAIRQKKRRYLQH